MGVDNVRETFMSKIIEQLVDEVGGGSNLRVVGLKVGEIF
jgi:hypothetical protein